MVSSVIEKKDKRKRWRKVAVYGAILIGLSVGFACLLQYLEARFDIFSGKFAPTAYLLVFGATLVCNASIIVPVAIHVSIMMAAASVLNPVLVALVASVAGALGEITGYYAGYFGKRVIVSKSTPGYDRVVEWMNRYGPWAIFLLSFQPVLPFDVAGLVAGASKMPLWKFLLPCWAGRFPKYVLFCYFGIGVFRLLPSWLQ